MVTRSLINSDAASQEVGGGSAFRALMSNIDRNFKAIFDGDVGGGSGAAIVDPGLRLSLTSGTAVTSTDVLGAATVYGVATAYNSAAVYDTATDAFVPRTFTADILLSITSLAASREYSIFLWWDSVALALKLGTGPVWATSLTVGTGAGTSETENFRGRLVNKFSISLLNGSTPTTVAAREALLVGGLGTTTIAGQTEDSAQKRLLSNLYNATPRAMRRIEGVDFWSGAATGAWRQANANALNQLEFFSVTGSYPVNAIALGHCSSSATGSAGTAIGLDGIVPSVGGLKCFQTVTTGVSFPQTAHYNEFPGPGRHTLKWLEFSGTVGTRTWFGDSANNTNQQTGIHGTVIN